MIAEGQNSAMQPAQLIVIMCLNIQMGQIAPVEIALIFWDFFSDSIKTLWPCFQTLMQTLFNDIEIR